MNLNLDSEISSSGFFSGFRSIWLAIGAVALLFALSGLSGCSQLMGGLRPDLNDEFRYESEPTRGGTFSEASLLDEGRTRGPDSENSMGHREYRGTTVGRMGGQGSWIAPGESEQPAVRQPSREEDEDQPKLAARPVLQQKYKTGNRATRADFIDESRADGSLWTSEGQTNYFLTKNQIKSQGDLITVVSDENFVKDVAAELKRTLAPDEREAELEIAQERLRRQMLGLPEDPATAGPAGDKVASTQASASRSPASDKDKADKKDVDVPNVLWADVDLRKSMEFKATDPVMMEVAERYPNGNYKLRGLKRIRVRGQSKMVSVMAIAKNSDISEDETINAGKLYEYRIEAVR